MGMEYRANAEKNFDEVFIDPIDYKEYLLNAIRQFVRYDIVTSVYNIPLCLLDKRVWNFATDSISDWKKTYTDNCDGCRVKDKCSGVFATSITQSKNIHKVNCLHKLPKDQSPSKLLEKYSDEILNNTDGKILDIACGYGRNAAFLASYDKEILCIDNNEESLEYIKAGNNLTTVGLKHPELLSTKKMDLKIDSWCFEDESISAIINVHFFLPKLIPYFVKSLKIGGYLLIETIDGKGNNYLELPEYNYLKNYLKNSFEFIYYKEKRVKPFIENKSSVKLFAKKRHNI